MTCAVTDLTLTTSGRRGDFSRPVRRAALILLLLLALPSTLLAQVPATQPVTAPASPPLRIFTWHDYNIPGVVPMIWAQVVWGHDQGRRRFGAEYHDLRPPSRALAAVLPPLRRRAPGERVIFLSHAGSGPRGFKSGDLLDHLTHGADIEPTRRWCQEFFAGLAAAGMELDLIVLDNEEHFGYWAVPHEEKPAFWRRLLERHESGLLQLPPELAALSPEAFQTLMFRPEGKRLVPLYNDWAEQVKREAIRRAIVEPAHEALGRPVPVGNYGDGPAAWATPDLNGWLERPEGHDTGSGLNLACPVTYLPPAGNRYKDLPPGDAARLAWTDARNRVRAALAAAKAPVAVAPWYAWPTYGRDTPAAWEAALKDDVRHGVRLMLFWGEARDWRPHRQYVAQVVAQLHELARDPLPDNVGRANLDETNPEWFRPSPPSSP